jgi:hypothetical protein
MSYNFLDELNESLDGKITIKTYDAIFSIHHDFISEVCADFLISQKDYKCTTTIDLAKNMYKKFGYLNQDCESLAIKSKLIIKIKAFSKIAAEFDYDPESFLNGVTGFDTSGNSTRDHSINYREDGISEELAAKSFDAGRQFSEKYLD